MKSSIFAEMTHSGHENLFYCSDERVGLRAIIAIHSTALGIGAGGIRMRPYESEEVALRDVLRLSRAMSYKAAIADLPFGGAKCVVLGDPVAHKTRPLLRSLGRFIDRLGGQYLAGEDVGTTQEDMEVIHLETKHVAVLPPETKPGEDGAYATAVGVIAGMRACLEATFGTEELSGRRVAVQGLGSVGFKLASMLVEAGASVVACDIDASKVEFARKRLALDVCPAEQILRLHADVFSPCALGETLTGEAVDDLRCEIICGSANNQLADPKVASSLHQRRILYAPDYVVNVGGLIYNTDYLQLGGFNRERVLQRIRRISQTMKAVLEESRRIGCDTAEAADSLAEQRIKLAKDRSRASDSASLQ